MKRHVAFWYSALVIAVLSFGLLGCPTDPTNPVEEDPADPRYGISLDKETYSIYVPIGDTYFATPADIKVKITNTGELPTKDMTVEIKNDEYNLFKLPDNEIPSLAPGEKAVFTVKVPQYEQGWTSRYTVDVVVGNKMVSKTLKVEYGAYYYFPLAVDLGSSFFQASSVINTITAEGKTAEMPWFSSNSGVAVFNGETLQLVGSGEVIVGYVSTTEPFSVKGRAITVHLENLAPWIVSASVDTTAPDTIHVAFNEPVAIVDKTKFQVKVNKFPTGNSATIAYLDNEGLTFREITAVAAAGDKKTWTLTMSAPAEYGEILRLETTESGAAEDEYDNELPKIPQMIIKNTVKRTRDSFENTAGFYVDGVLQSTTADAALLRTALTAIDGYAAADKLNKRWTIVLGEDQTSFAPGGTFSGGTFTGSTIIITSADAVDKIITTTAGTGLTARNGLTIIIDEHIVFKGPAANTDQLIRVMDQGKIILDGGEIRDNTSTQGSDNAGGVRIGGGSNGAWFIMNSGKITGNTAINNSATTSGINTYGGGVSISDYGVFIMYDGEISGNTARGTNAYIPRAGGIATPYNRGTGRYQNNAVFILGGEITNNKVEGSAAIASAGGILTSGTFQKTGGTIKDNTTEFTGNVNAAQVAAIISSIGANPTVDAAAIRNTAAGPEIELIVDFGAAAHTIPEWGPLPGYWEK